MALLVALGGLGYYFFIFQNQPKTVYYNAITVEKKDLLQKVSATGQVKSQQTVDLAFDKSGKIARVHVAIGDRVKKGTLLIELEKEELWADLLEAQAQIEREQAQLEELKQGTRSEEINVYKANLVKSETALNDAKNHLIYKLREMATRADDVVHNKMDLIFENPRTNPQIVFHTKNSHLKNELIQQRQDIALILVDWQMVLKHLWINSDFERYTKKTEVNLLLLKTFLDNLALLVNELSPDSNLSQTTIDAWKEKVSLSRTSIHTALNEVHLANEKLNTAESSVLQNKKELTLKASKATPQSITVYGAEVKSAEARLNRVYARLSKNLIKAPFDGMVTKNEARKGEMVLPEKILVSLIGKGLEIKAHVPEIDIAKVKLNDPVEIVFDAIENKHYTGLVSAIHPVGISQQGVVYYETTVLFESSHDLSAVKPGMTADLEILTDKRIGILSIPQRSVISRDGKKFLKVLVSKINDKGKPEDVVKEKEVITGLKGSDGEIEIQEGLSEGDRVIISLNNH